MSVEFALIKPSVVILKSLAEKAAPAIWSLYCVAVKVPTPSSFCILVTDLFACKVAFANKPKTNSNAFVVPAIDLKSPFNIEANAPVLSSLFAHPCKFSPIDCVKLLFFCASLFYSLRELRLFISSMYCSFKAALSFNLASVDKPSD